MHPREAAQLMATVADAVHHIHQAGLLHLDLKPSNILLDAAPGALPDQETPKVADFGIARILADAELTGTGDSRDGSWDGTPAYMAPEQVSGMRDQLCPATDVHALGAILYRLVTGIPPYQGATPLATLNDLHTREPLPPRQLNPRLSRDLQTIILKCLEKDPGRRYPAASSLAEDLRLWLDGRPIQARPVGIGEKTWRWSRRRPAIAFLTASLVSSFVIGFWGMFLLWRHGEAERVRAESARQDAERHLEVASSIIGHLEDIVMGSLTDTVQLQGAGLDRTITLLREQVAKVRKSRGFSSSLLFSLGPINWEIACRLRNQADTMRP